MFASGYEKKLYRRVRKGIDIKWEIEEAIIDFKIKAAKKKL